MFRKDQEISTKEPGQASSSPVSGHQDPGRQSEEDRSSRGRLYLTEDSVDFRSVLGTVATGQSEESASEGAHPAQSHKDLNISSVITQIRDEGPAASRQDNTSRLEQYRQNEAVDDPVQKEAIASEQAPALAAAEITRLAKSAAEELLSSREEPPDTRGGGMPGKWITGMLLLLLAAGGYLHYKTNSDLSLARTNIVQLSTRLLKAEEAVAGLRRQVSANIDSVQSAYAQDRLRKELTEHRRLMKEEMDRRLNEMMLVQEVYSAAGYSPASASVALVKSRPVESVATPSLKAADDRINKLTPGKGGDWQVYLASYSSRPLAKKALKQLVTTMPQAVVQSARVKDKKVYRVVVPGFSGKKEAGDYLNTVSGKLGLKGAWIGRRAKNT